MLETAMESVFSCPKPLALDGETVETVSDFSLFWGGAPKLLQMVTAAMKLKDAYSWVEKL